MEPLPLSAELEAPPLPVSLPPSEPLPPAPPSEPPEDSEPDVAAFTSAPSVVIPDELNTMDAARTNAVYLLNLFFITIQGMYYFL